jgi:hypothetical protein
MLAFLIVVTCKEYCRCRSPDIGILFSSVGGARRGFSAIDRNTAFGKGLRDISLEERISRVEMQLPQADFPGLGSVHARWSWADEYGSTKG